MGHLGIYYFRRWLDTHYLEMHRREGETGEASRLLAQCYYENRKPLEKRASSAHSFQVTDHRFQFR